MPYPAPGQRNVRRIIGAGLPRTGTTSMTAALEILGFGPVMHGANDDDRPRYTKILKAKNEHPTASADQLTRMTGVSLWDMTAPYTSTLDLPTCDLSVELSALYPDALVILTTRDSDDAWWRSWNQTWGAYHSSGVSGYFLRFLIWPVPEVRASIRMVSTAVAGWQLRYGELGPSVHHRHKQDIIRRIPADRLLVYNVKQGWPPLCKFLGVDIPAVPFPHVNDSAEASRVSRVLKIQAVVNWVILGALVVGGVSVTSFLHGALRGRMSIML
ncbi:hypothetical protein BDW69DRAFT_180128 [Aspergillus filifer]